MSEYDKALNQFWRLGNQLGNLAAQVEREKNEGYKSFLEDELQRKRVEFEHFRAQLYKMKGWA